MADINMPIPRAGFGQTSRRDLWWAQPLVVFLGLSGFVVYATWAALQGTHYRFGPYLSPFYSPDLLGDAQAWFGARPAWYPGWLPFSPAIFILWAPGGFRLTCYYYRGAYYKAFWADPPTCAVGEPRKCYRGERSLPLVLQNFHRYFLYIALVFLVILASDAWRGFWFNGHFSVHVGSLVLVVNVILLGSYTLGCHSLRHLTGGLMDALSPARKKVYHCVSAMNVYHMRYAWLSLFWVGFADFYIRMCSMGIWTDWRIF